MKSLKIFLIVLFATFWWNSLSLRASDTISELSEETGAPILANHLNIEVALHDELLLHCFSYLSLGHTLIAAQVNKRWRTVADDNMHWKNLARVKYPFWADAIINKGENAKEQLKNFPRNLEGFLEGIQVKELLTTANYGKLGIISFTDKNRVIWQQNANKLIMTEGTGTKESKEFICDLTDIIIVKDDTNSVLPFTAADGEIIWLKCFDAVGYDTRSINTYGYAYRSALLVCGILNDLRSITAITAISLPQIPEDNLTHYPDGINQPTEIRR